MTPPIEVIEIYDFSDESKADSPSIHQDDEEMSAPIAIKCSVDSLKVPLKDYIKESSLEVDLENIVAV